MRHCSELRSDAKEKVAWHAVPFEWMNGRKIGA